MNILLREKTNVLKDKIKDLSYNIDIQKNKIETQSKYIRDITALTEENKKEYELRIQESKNSIDALQAQNSELSMGLEESIREAENGLQSLQDRKQSLLLGSQDKLSSIRDVEKRITFFEENGSCPVCDQAISDGHKHEILTAAEEQKRGWKSALKAVGEEGTQVETKISEQTSVLTGLRARLSKLSENNREIDTLHKTIQGYQQSIEKEVGADLQKAKEDLDNLNKEKDGYLESKLNLSDEYNYNIVIGEMLKDTGIKTKIIKQYLPAINKLVNQYLQVLDFFVHFDLDESFQETIRSRHRDEFTYDSFSEGEKQRIDLALLFTWRQIAKMKNSVATNLLILDETFDSSLDHDGVENLLKILYTLDDNTNVFVISHKGEILDGKFKSKIEFKKEKNFSKMVA